MSDTEEEKERERIALLGRRLADPDTQSRAKFSEVRGLCRTCRHAILRRRQYSEAPQVICTATYEQPHRVPLDITECSEYGRQGEMHIRDMNEIALIIDPRKKGGQYL